MVGRTSFYLVHRCLIKMEIVSYNILATCIEKCHFLYIVLLAELLLLLFMLYVS